MTAASTVPAATFSSTDQRYDEASHQVEFGTLAEQLDETAYDKRRNNNDIEDDNSAEEGRINFPVDRLYGRDEELKMLKRLCVPAASTAGPEAGAEKKELESEGFPSRVIFLGGLSGAGKSALIQTTVKELRKESRSFFFLSGKYNNTRTKPPFSALSEALKRLVREMVRPVGSTRSSSGEELKQLRKRLLAQRLTEDSEDTHVLASVMIPSMPRLFRKQGSSSISDDSFSVTSRSTSATGAASIGYDMNAIKYAFLSLVKGLPTSNCPLILFLDDLQWADDSSLVLLKWILKDNAKMLPNFVFIGAYRSNEVAEEHPFHQMMQEVSEARVVVEDDGCDVEEDSSICKAWQLPAVHSMVLSNLQLPDIAAFIADSLERSVEDVAAISEAVYTKTLGNIFFVKQSLEELVRSNALYYDIVFYQWQIREISRADLLAKFLVADDVVKMVQNKLATLPQPLQRALSVAALTRNALDVTTLKALLEAGNVVPMDNFDLSHFLSKAVRQGILLELHDQNKSKKDLTRSLVNKSQTTYKFAHDRIQEAAMLSVPEGKERNQLLNHIADVLLKLGDSDEVDGDDNSWMFFVAVHHKNKLPPEMVGAIEIVQLNLRVGKIAVFKAAFGQAAELLREASKRLPANHRWNEHYDLTLDLCNTLLHVEHSLGNEDQAIAAAAEVVEKARSLEDQCIANVVLLEAQAAVNHPFHAKTIPQAMVILNRFGIDVPPKPSVFAVLREIAALKWKQGFRPLYELIASYPPSTNPVLDTQIKLISRGIFYSFGAKDFVAGFLLTCRGMRLVLQHKMITKNVPDLTLFMGLPSRMQEKFDACASFADASNTMISRYPEEPPKIFAKVQYIILAGLSMVQIPYVEGVSKFLALQKTLLTNGEHEDSFLCATYVPYSYFNASLPLNALIEPKLVEYHELATTLGRQNFANIFAMFRQLIFNLQGKAANPTSLEGPIYHEEKILEGLEGDVAKLTLHDLSICRLLLATIFDDEEVMEQMLVTLHPYEVFDPDLPRQYYRMSWVGLAATILFTRRRKVKKIIKKWSKVCYKHFQNYVSAGSLNGKVVFASLTALQKNTKKDFDHAIEVTSGVGHLCLSGLMNEHCAKILPQGSDQHQEYLKRAYWAYQDWGATGKTRQLETDHGFLRNMRLRNHAPARMSALLSQSRRMEGGRPPMRANGTVH